MLECVIKLYKDLDYLYKPNTNELITAYLRSKEEKYKVNINIESDFILITDDLIDDYIIHILLNVRLGDDSLYYKKMSELYSELF